MNNCNRCYYNDAKENVCTHESPIFIDDVCTDYQDSEFVMQIRADAIEECENYLIDSFNRANPNEMLSIGKVIEVFVLLFNQLKEQNK